MDRGFSTLKKSLLSQSAGFGFDVGKGLGNRQDGFRIAGQHDIAAIGEPFLAVGHRRRTIRFLDVFFAQKNGLQSFALAIQEFQQGRRIRAFARLLQVHARQLRGGDRIRLDDFQIAHLEDQPLTCE